MSASAKNASDEANSGSQEVIDKAKAPPRKGRQSRPRSGIRAALGSDSESQRHATDSDIDRRASIPCRFHPKGLCNKGESCPYKHSNKPTKAAAATPTTKGAGSKPAAKAKAAVAGNQE